MNTKQWSAWLLAAGITTLISAVAILQSGEQIDANNTRIILANMSKAQKDSVIHVEIHRAKVGDEIVSMRSKNAKTFKGNNGQFRAVISAIPKHYFDKTDSVYKDIDLTVYEVDESAKSSPDRKFDKYVDAGPYTASWFNDKPWDYTFIKDGYYVKYTALFDTTNIEIETLSINTGVKQNIILENDNAPTEYRWIFDTNAQKTFSNDGLYCTGNNSRFLFMTTPPTARDSLHSYIPVTVALSGDTLSYTLSIPENVTWPVMLDPTTTVQAQNDGFPNPPSETAYATARDKDDCGNVTTSEWRVGQSKSTNYTVWRAFASFPVPGMKEALACTLYVNGYVDYSTTDFEIYIHGASAYKSILTATDFPNFDGRQTGSAHTGTVLNNAWNSSSYSSNWNKILFNSAGLDSIEAASGDTLWIALISKEDYNNSAPTNNEYLRLNSSEDSGSEPYLSLTYKTVVESPQNFIMTALDTTRIACSWADSSDNEEKFYIINWADSSVVDSTAANAVADTISGLSINTKYIWAVVADSAGVKGYSDPDNSYTLLPAPESSDIAIMPINSDTLRVKVAAPANGTADSTGMEVYAVSGEGADGSGWITGVYSYLDGGLNPDSTYVYKVRYRNGDGDSTAWSDNMTYAMNGLDTLTVHLSGDAYDDYNVDFGNGRRDSTVVRVGASDSGEKLDGFLSFEIPWYVHKGGVDSFFITMTRSAEKSAETPTLKVYGITVKDLDPVENINLSALDSTGVSVSWTIDSGEGIRTSPNMRDSFREWQELSPFRDHTYGLGFRLDDNAQADSVRAVFLDYSHPSYSDGTSLTIYYTPGKADSLDAAPSDFSISVEGPDSLLASWTDNSSYELGFVPLNYSDSTQVAGTDTLAENTTSIGVGGLTPNTIYQWFVRAFSAVDDSSSAGTSARTEARTPGTTTVIAIYDTSLKFIINPVDNPSWTTFAIQDSITGYYIDGAAEPDTLRPGPAGDWGWKTYSQWGSASGDTLEGLKPDSLYVLRAKAKSGE